jgi:hypothetical protein
MCLKSICHNEPLLEDLLEADAQQGHVFSAAHHDDLAREVEVRNQDISFVS